MRDVGVGLIGSGFVADLHAQALKLVPHAELAAVASPTEANVRRFAERHQIPRHYTDYRHLLELDDVHMVSVAAPNLLHHEIVLAAASAGKHIVCEKPLARTLAEAQAMVATCR